MLHDLGFVYAISADDMLSILPEHHIDDNSLRAIRKELKEQGALVDKKWKGFAQDPADQSPHEDKVFSAFPELFSAVAKACSAKVPALNQARQKLRNSPSTTPLSLRVTTSKPDGNMYRQPERCQLMLMTPETDRWEDAAVTLEYKKKNEIAQRSDNDGKIIWSMHHITRTDPCRRFVIGMTVENTSVRIWFCCRATVLVSRAIDFNLHFSYFVRFIASLTFASEAELGWDPTVERTALEANQFVYRITVHNSQTKKETIYITDKILSDFGAEAMRGRGTRVFRAYEADKRLLRRGPEPCVLKDMWIEEDRLREGDILTTLFSKIRSERGNSAAKSAQKYFLTVLNHGDVLLGTQGEQDHTLNTIMRGHDLPSNHNIYNLIGGVFKPPKPNSQSVGHPTPYTGHSTEEAMRSGNPDYPFSDIDHRVHYRIVFKELGIALSEIHDLKVYFTALRDATIALKIMHENRWVHRDVSAGNILYIEESRGGVLADLEYARDMDHSGPPTHNERTGTPHFMPVEMALGALHFRPESSKYELRFQHNPLHDLESIWWIGTWALFMHAPPDHAATREFDISSQMRMCDKLFPQTHPCIGLRATVFLGGSYVIGYEHLHPTFHGIWDALHKNLTHLVKRYKLAEAGTKIDETAFVGIHDILISGLNDAVNAAPVGEMKSLESDMLARYGDDGMPDAGTDDPPAEMYDSD